MDIHEVREEEIEGFVRLRNEVFRGGEVPVEWWRALYLAEPRVMTGVIAVEAGRVLGAVSYLLKRLQAAPGCVLRTAFANAVGVAEEARSRGLGSRMHQAAREILPSYSDALLVIIHEGQKAYPFYRRNGYVLLHMPLTLSWSLEEVRGPMPAGIEAGEGWDLYRRNEETLLGLFGETYGTAGGFYRHEPGWLEPSRGHHDSNDDGLYRERLRTVLLRRGGVLVGYALLRLPGRPEAPAQLNELAVAGGEAATALELLRAVSVLCREAGTATLTAFASAGHPLREALFALARKRERRLGIFGQPLEAERVGGALYGRALEEVGIRLELAYRANGREGRVVLGPGPVRLALAMEYEEWVRALFRRTSLLAGVRTGMVSVIEGTAAALLALEQAAGPVPWVYLGSTYT